MYRPKPSGGGTNAVILTDEQKALRHKLLRKSANGKQQQEAEENKAQEEAEAELDREEEELIRSRLGKANGTGAVNESNNQQNGACTA